MADFEPAVEYVLSNEGGLVDDPADPGGLTAFGISQRAYPGVNIRALTRDDAIAIYRRDYWKYGDLASQRVATKVFDMAVNGGENHAVKTLQTALQAIQAGPIVADGVLGVQTIARANAADEIQLIDELKARAALGICLLLFGAPDRRDELLGLLRRAVRG